MTQVHVALLRGINVGGKHMLPMKQLAAMFGDAGCGDVQTYIQSGNVVFRATPALARRVPALIAEAVSNRFGFQTPVVTRTVEELRNIARHNPFPHASANPGTLFVAFLESRPGAAKVAKLDPERSPPDRFAVRGREVYLHCPNGIGRSKLTNEYFESRLATASTVRNWKTLLALIEMAGAR
jgi:uncharacterized protein (DUF1697 family)